MEALAQGRLAGRCTGCYQLARPNPPWRIIMRIRRVRVMVLMFHGGRFISSVAGEGGMLMGIYSDGDDDGDRDGDSDGDTDSPAVQRWWQRLQVPMVMSDNHKKLKLK